jgi:hypothetical protein
LGHPVTADPWSERQSVSHYSRRFPPNHWPSWFTNTIAIWFIVNFVTLVLLIRLTRRLFKTGVVDFEKARAYGERALRTSTRLMIFWSLLFLYGVVQTARGKFPLERAIPAGALLLFFIAPGGSEHRLSPLCSSRKCEYGQFCWCAGNARGRCCDVHCSR